MTILALAVAGRGLVDPEEPIVHADDEALMRGRAAFETVRVYGGRPFRLDRHLERLEASAARLALPRLGRDVFEDLAARALEAAGVADAVLRTYWTAGREGRGALAYALVQPLPDDVEEQRARGLALVPIRLGLEGPGLLGGVKSTSYALNMVAQDEARRRGADDAVFLGAGDVVLEAPTANLWWRRGETLFTPSVAVGILAGVTRAVLLELAPALGYETRESVFTLADLVAADEAFTSSSVREVMPVRAVDGSPLTVGLASRRLQEALRAAATR